MKRDHESSASSSSSDDDDEDEDRESEEEEEEEELSELDQLLWYAANENDTETVQESLEMGADLNCVYNDSTPLSSAAEMKGDQIVRILLDAGADTRWRSADTGGTAVIPPCLDGHLSTVQMLIHHDPGLLGIGDEDGWTPLFMAVRGGWIHIVRFLLDQGANVHAAARDGRTTLMIACHEGNLDIVRLLMAAGGNVESRAESEQTALHYAAERGNVQVMRELILEHNANMSAETNGRPSYTPFDVACMFRHRPAVEALLEIYGNKLTQEQGRNAMHHIFDFAEEYDDIDDEDYDPTIKISLGTLTLEHLRTLLRSLDPALIRHHDERGKLPIHYACRDDTPVPILALLRELDPATLHMADNEGSLPIHVACTGRVWISRSTVRFLVEKGGVRTLAARNHQGALPLHLLCESLEPALPTVKYLVQSFPRALVARTNAGLYPFMIAASAGSWTKLSVVYELVRASLGFVVRE